MRPVKIAGRSEGVGEFVEGELWRRGREYELRATRIDGVRFGALVSRVIFEGHDISPNVMDVSGLEFRASEAQLDLRRPSGNQL